MKQRIFYLDSLKGSLIILVILGHAIQFCIPDYEHNFMFRFIYSFHMPLFFFISGYLTYRGKYVSSVIGKRSTQLLLPFITWAFLSPLLMNGSFDMQYSLQILIYPDKGLWFLYNLFIYSALLNASEWIDEKHRIKQEYMLAAIYAMLVAFMVLLHTKFNCSQLCYHFPFYLLGYIYNKHNNMLNQYVLFGWIFAVTVIFWTPNDSPLFYDTINLGGTFAYFYRYFVQFVGMFFFYQIGKKYLDINIPWLHRLGANTLGIYAVQFLILKHLIYNLPIEHEYLKICIVFVLSVPLSYGFVYLVRQLKYVRLLLIGEK